MNTIPNMAEFEAAAKKEFAASADIRTEFGGDEVAYVAFKKAEARGQVRIFEKPTGEITGGNSIVEITVDKAGKLSESSGQIYSERRHCFVSSPALV